MVAPPDGENCGGSFAGAGEIVLFGVRVVVESMRKCVSLNNLSLYEHPQDSPNNISNGEKDAIFAAGYASADNVVHHSSSANNRERKRGVPWTEEEHKRFLIGLNKLGKGDWRGIAKNFVKTRTPTQVASHAQKYYIRRTSVNRRRRRSSLFDLTTDSVAASPQSPAEASTQTTSNDDKSLVPMEMLPNIPPATVSTTADFDLNMHSVTEPVLSLNLSLSSSSSSSSSRQQQQQQQQKTAFQIIPNCGASIMGMA